MATVTPFPWASLKGLRSEDVVLRNKLVAVYQMTQGHTDFLQSVFGKAISDLARANVQIELSHVSSAPVGQMVKGVAAELLMGVVTLEPLGKKAVITFEPSLAKLLVQCILAGESFQTQNFFKSEVRPVTALEEAVIQYTLVAILDRFILASHPKNFKPLLDDVSENTAKFATIFLAQDMLACFSLRARLFDHDFFIKVYLSLETSHDLMATQALQSMMIKGVQQMGRLTTPLQLEIASVTLTPAELENLDIGDILLFDETQAVYHNGQVEGCGALVFTETQEQHGYTVDVHSDPKGLRVKLLGVL